MPRLSTRRSPASLLAAADLAAQALHVTKGDEARVYTKRVQAVPRPSTAVRARGVHHRLPLAAPPTKRPAGRWVRGWGWGMGWAWAARWQAGSVAARKLRRPPSPSAPAGPSSTVARPLPHHRQEMVFQHNLNISSNLSSDPKTVHFFYS